MILLHDFERVIGQTPGSIRTLGVVTLALQKGCSEEIIKQDLSQTYDALEGVARAIAEEVGQPREQAPEKIRTAAEAGLVLAWQNCAFRERPRNDLSPDNEATPISGSWINTAILSFLPSEEHEKLYADPEYVSEQYNAIILNVFGLAEYFKHLASNLDFESAQVMAAAFYLAGSTTAKKALDPQPDSP